MNTEETGAARYVALLGTLAAAFLIAGLLVFGSNTPDTGDGGAKILRFYTNHSSQQEVAAYMVALAGVALLLFGAALRQRLTSVQGPASAWLSVVTAGTTVAATAFVSWTARALPHPFLVAGLLAAVISITPIGFVGGMLAFLWVGALGIYLALRPAVSPARAVAA